MFFAGCSPSILRPDQASAVARIFAAMEEPIGYLGKEERCCGSTLLRIGEENLFMEMARANLDAMRKAGARRVVVTCAGCFKSWKEDYPERLGPTGIEVVHVSELIEQALDSGKLLLRPVPENERRVTYHDPCHLGRAEGVYEPPRKVLASVPGIRLVEMAFNRENSACCGSGGGVRTARPALSASIGAKRVQMAEETGASEVISCCPWCEQNLEDCIKASGRSGLKVRDLVEVVAAAVTGKGEG